MASPLPTEGPPEGGYRGVDLDHVRRALEGVGCVLGRLACAVGPLRGVFGILGSFRQGQSPDLYRVAEIGDGGAGGGADLGLARHTLDGSGRVVLRGGDGRLVSVGEEKYLLCRGIGVTHCPKKSVYTGVELEDLPEDVLRKIFSKLQLDEIVRTSVLSSRWKRMWTISSRLHLDCIAICGQHRYFSNKKKCTWEFIDCVNLVLQQLHGEVIEELEVKVEYDGMLHDHLDNWIRFAISSLTKSLALDLAPAEIWDVNRIYLFPLEFFDRAAGRYQILQHIQLSCVSFKLDSDLRGFSKLRKLDLHLFDISGKDLEYMLSCCSNLEWLSLSRWRMEGELKVKKPLVHLVHLRIMKCRITNLELHAENLKTFIYNGLRVPIDLGRVKQLETAEVDMHYVTLEYAVTVLPRLLPGVRNLSMDTRIRIEMPLRRDSVSCFSRLKVLQLYLSFDVDNNRDIYSLVFFLRAAPFLEELEMHFAVYSEPVRSESVQSTRPWAYEYLKKVRLTRFNGSWGEVELLVHIVENAPALKFLTIDPYEEATGVENTLSRLYARTHLAGKILRSTVFRIV